MASEVSAKLGCGRTLALVEKVLGRPAEEQLTSSRTSFGPQVDDPLATSDEIRAVLDDDDAIAVGYQPSEALMQKSDIGEMEPCRRLIEEIEFGISSGLLWSIEKTRQLEALGLAARQSGRRLAQADIAESHIRQNLQLAGQPSVIFEANEGFGDGQLQGVIDVETPVADREYLGDESSALASITEGLNRRHEVHVDFDFTSSLAFRATSLVGVERKVTWSDGRFALGSRSRREGLPKIVVSPDVGHRIGSR